MNLYIDENLSSKVIIPALEKSHRVDYPRREENRINYNITARRRKVERWLQRLIVPYTARLCYRTIRALQYGRALLELFELTAERTIPAVGQFLRKKIQSALYYLPGLRRPNTRAKTDDFILAESVQTGSSIVSIDRDFILLARDYRNEGTEFPNIYIVDADTKRTLTDHELSWMLRATFESAMFLTNVHSGNSQVYRLQYVRGSDHIHVDRYDMGSIGKERPAKGKVKFDVGYDKRYAINTRGTRLRQISAADQ